MGTHQWMTALACAVPWIAATIMLVCGVATFDQWSSFTCTLIPVVLGTQQVVSGGIKTAAMFKRPAKDLEQ